MRWSEISSDNAAWTIPAERSKNGKAHEVHLGPEASAVLAALPRQGESDLIFTTNGETAVSGFSKARERLGGLIAKSSAGTSADDWRFHDFRRTCVTWLASAGFNTSVADKILNHFDGDRADGMVGQVYQRAEYLPERRAALEAWARHVIACASGSENTENKVVQLRRG